MGCESSLLLRSQGHLQQRRPHVPLHAPDGIGAPRVKYRRGPYPHTTRSPASLSLGSNDMEDVPMTTVVMPPVAEDGESVRTHSRNVSEASSYVQVSNDAHVSTPLLSPDEIDENENENDNTNANVTSQTDFSAGDDSRAALLSDRSPDPDPRGEAPPYFQVESNPVDGSIHRTGNDLARTQTIDTLPSAPATPTPGEQPAPALAELEAGSGSTRRRSVFRGLLSALTPRATAPPTAPASPPSASTQPTASRVSTDAEPRPSGLSTRTNARSPLATHRPSHSGSTSVFSITSSAIGRTVSRTRTRSNSNFHAAGANLTSPSSISINSISSPLTHTLVRTDFVYPRSGPTPEQLKLISSRESVGKFGVPYGADARAFAASTSRVNLHGPPPEFEERQSIDGLPRPSGEYQRTPSRLAGNRSTPSPETAADARTSSERQQEPSGSTITQNSIPGTSTSLTSETSAGEAGSSLSPIQDVTSEITSDTPNPNSEPSSTSERPPSPAASTSTGQTAHPSPVADATSSPTSLSPPTSATLSKKPSSTQLSGSGAPPTAFRMPTSPLGGVRSESRASSVMTFATADTSFPETPTSPEIVVSGTPRGPSPEPEPSTPKAQHGGLPDVREVSESGASVSGV
ncbi:hypothetical protein BV25DRAFT_1286423 [Artomyces pyxidatus]|uniref:Uncharacterized protein n=1 Tax=Artomyces pyxidatus TaxID=48021 RepID=A0ACB8SR16_9AGAM|nr:hypothetical protein BV25DRAFT_1286423 [Artomyces pyxidatus]